MIEKKIIALIQETLNTTSNITLKTSPNDVDEWDSLGHIMLIQAIEENFKISFDFDEMLNLDTVHSIVTLIKSKTS